MKSPNKPIWLSLVAVSVATLVACGDDSGSATSSGGAGGSTSPGATTNTTNTTNTTSATTSTTVGAGGAASAMMTFFLTSVGNGANGANFGGVAGADKLCQDLATGKGSTRTWRAYVSTAAEDARDRIGTGPWHNADDVIIAADITELHTTGLLGPVILTENGGGIDFANAHDVITGSNADGTFSGNNCQDYSVADPNDFTNLVTVGHADATKNDQFENWNATHPSQGCSAEALQKTAGQAHLYCFAID